MMTTSANPYDAQLVPVVAESLVEHHLGCIQMNKSADVIKLSLTLGISFKSNVMLPQIQQSICKTNTNRWMNETL